jgi:hypothetical protein
MSTGVRGFQVSIPGFSGEWLGDNVMRAGTAFSGAML